MTKAKLLLVPVIAISAIAMLAPLSQVYAVEGAQLRETVQNRVTYKCDVVTTRVNLLTARYNNNKERYTQRYQNMAEKVANAIKTLEAKGYDVSVVKADLAVFNQKLQKFAADFAKFHNTLESSKGNVCGQSNGDFLATLKTSRTQLQVVRADSLDLRSYYQTSLRPAIQDLKKQVTNK